MTGAERRRDVRVIANGSVLLPAPVATRGRLVNLSTGGVCFELTAAAQLVIGELVAIDLHLDRADSTWLSFQGRVLRIAGPRVVVELSEAPVAFGDVMSRAIVSAIEAVDKAHLLLVDPELERRAVLAALLRRAECRVAEVSTPLEAIAHLAGSAIQSWVIVIADTTPSGIADDLRAFLSSEHPRLEIVTLDALSPSVALMRVFARPAP